MDEEVKNEKTSIVVPKGIRYLGTWQGEGSYRLEDYPFPHILDKVLTGCGFTEYCLTNSQNVILCSPRRMLLENKESQHKGEIYYAKNGIYDSASYDISLDDSNLEKKARKDLKNTNEEDENVIKQKIMKFKENVLYYCLSCMGRPMKIIVTYDSFKHVKEVLQENKILDKFQVVVDEFQSILVDVKFKSDTELQLLDQLKDIQKVCFVSATPMLDKYLKRIDEFKDLPYYRLDWETEDPGRIINPNLNVKAVDSVFKEMVKVINKYKEGKFERSSTINPETGKIEEVISKEAVLYINSVKTICSMITKCELTTDNTNILCARTDENNEKVRKAFNDVRKKLGIARIPKGTMVIGDIPGKGEQHKMFTFCTRTVYLGADFYSTNARSFVFSDANIDCLVVDISMDLPQIIGRQRLLENPWKNSAEIFIKSTMLQLNRKKFDEKLARKIEGTEQLLAVYDRSELKEKMYLSRKYLIAAKASLYKDDYIAVNQHSGQSLQPVFNKLMLVADERAFDIQQVDYKDRVSVFNTMEDKGFTVIQVDEWLKGFNSIRFYHDKMKFVCHLEKELGDKDKFNLFLNSIPISFKNYYTILGPEKCKACCYQKGEMEKAYNRLVVNQSIEIGSEILKYFKVGDRLTKSHIKAQLGVIYKSCGYEKTPRAIDLGEYFEIKPILLTNKETKKREAGFELISKVEKIDID